MAMTVADTIHVVAVRIVEIIAALTMLSGIGLLFYRIKRQPNEVQKYPALGARTVQFVGVTMALPLILILGLEGKLESSAIAALLGAFFGYVLSHVGRYQLRGANDEEETPPDDRGARPTTRR
jgi:hypothetical protein